jgi:hypothetical protein
MKDFNCGAFRQLFVLVCAASPTAIAEYASKDSTDQHGSFFA